MNNEITNTVMGRIHFSKEWKKKWESNLRKKKSLLEVKGRIGSKRVKVISECGCYVRS